MKGASFQSNALRNKKRVIKKKENLWERLRPFLNDVLVSSGIFLCISGGFAFIELRKASIGLQQTESSLNTFIQLGTVKTNQISDDSHRILVEVGLTTKEIRLASKSQREFWNDQAPKLVARMNGTFDRTDAVLESAKKTLDATTDNEGKIVAIVQDLDTHLYPSLTEAADAFKEVATTAKKTGDVISGPVKGTLENVDSGTKHIDSVLGNVDKKVDSYMHPTFWGKVRGWTLFGLELLKDGMQIHYYSVPATVNVIGAVPQAASRLHHVDRPKPTAKE